VVTAFVRSIPAGRLPYPEGWACGRL